MRVVVVLLPPAELCVLLLELVGGGGSPLVGPLPSAKTGAASRPTAENKIRDRRDFFMGSSFFPGAWRRLQNLHPMDAVFHKKETLLKEASCPGRS